MTFPPSPETFSRVQDCDVPIFRQAHDQYSLFYAPGYLTVVDKEQSAAFEADLRLGVTARWASIATLRTYASRAISTWAESQSRPYSPVCLTLYLNNECNLACTYCYSNPTPRPAPRLALDAIQVGAEYVAQNCVARQCGFTAVFHGGGEPTLHEDALNEALDAIEHITAVHNVSLFRYIATNGVISPAKAQLVARRFDLIGLSCDGTQSIQSQQRPLWGGGDSSEQVERTAHIIHEIGKRLHVRVTITPQNVRRQCEIAEYICQTLQPEEIHVEPVYKAGRAGAGDCFKAEQADEFVAEFLKARDLARQYRIPWQISGSRPGEIHGPYCNIFRDVLNLVPGGAATACFKTTTAAQTRSAGVMVGEISGGFLPDQEHIQSLRRSLRAFPPKCDNCFNQYHCVRDCPDHCPLEGLIPSSEFGCRVQKTYVNTVLRESAEIIHATQSRDNGVAEGKVIIL